MQEQQAISISAIDHINLTVSNLEHSLTFYQRTFGLEVREDGRDRERPFVIVGRAGAGYLALHERAVDGGPVGGHINHWGFVVDDFDGTIARLDDLGVPVLYRDNGADGIIDYPRSRSVYVADPDGTEIELTSSFGGGLG
jgi:catechol 2,3-dioxygenase-like lactoylglutathione lyase family enzyme